MSWIVHLTMAAIVTPLIGGHMYMAMINRGSRVGLPGMITGFVDRQWATHHYRRWYREHYELDEQQPVSQDAPQDSAVSSRLEIDEEEARAS